MSGAQRVGLHVRRIVVEREELARHTSVLGCHHVRASKRIEDALRHVAQGVCFGHGNRVAALPKQLADHGFQRRVADGIDGCPQPLADLGLKIVQQRFCFGF